MVIEFVSEMELYKKELSKKGNMNTEKFRRFYTIRSPTK